MAYLSKMGYVERQKIPGRRKNNKKQKRDWWLIKYDGNQAVLSLNKIYLPNIYLGKRVRIKLQVEVIEEKQIKVLL